VTPEARHVPSRIFWGIASFQVMAMFRRGLFYSFLSIYLRFYLGLSVTETTLFATLPMLFNVICQTYVWGGVSDRRQLRRTLIVWGELLAGIGTILVWYLHTLAGVGQAAGYVIILGLAVVEIFWSMSNVGWSALISDIYGIEDRGAVQGRLTSVGGLGRILGIWIGGLLYDGMGLRYEGWGFQEGVLFFIASGAMVVSVLPMLLVPEGGIGKGGGAPEAPPPEAEAGTRAAFILFLWAMVFINFGRNSIAVIMSQYLALDSGLALAGGMISHVVNMQSVAVIGAGLMVGRLAGKYGHRRVLIWGTWGAAASLVILAGVEGLAWMFAANFIRGVSEALITASAYALASVLIPPERRGRGFGLFNATFFLSWGLAGTFISGPVIDGCMALGVPEVSAYQAAFMAAAVVTAVGMGLLLKVGPAATGSR
jgi:MFS family permease